MYRRNRRLVAVSPVMTDSKPYDTDRYESVPVERRPASDRQQPVVGNRICLLQCWNATVANRQLPSVDDRRRDIPRDIDTASIGFRRRLPKPESYRRVLLGRSLSPRWRGVGAGYDALRIPY
ncbi:hypothetical protein D8S78_11235 [Natrialba swarupiae]|nr:hypothetical protein [Natrialba swarupiae]